MFSNSMNMVKIDGNMSGVMTISTNIILTISAPVGFYLCKSKIRSP